MIPKKASYVVLVSSQLVMKNTQKPAWRVHIQYCHIMRFALEEKLI